MRFSIRCAMICWALAALPAIAAEKPPATDPRPTAKLDAILRSLDTTGAVFSARVLELPSGRELYAHEPDRPMMPASNGKLPNAAAALDHFGPRHTFQTWLALDGDHLWLIGCGDPGCGDEVIAASHHSKTTTMLDEWADALKSRGITHVKGNLYFDDGVFDDQWVSPTWSKDFLTDWYAAPLTGLTFNDNCIDVTVYPTEPGKPARYEVVPLTTSVLKVINETHTARNAERKTVAIARDPGANTFTLTGIVTKKTRVESKPITDPGAFFADALRTNFKSHGIAIDGVTERAPRQLARRKWLAFQTASVTATSPSPDPRIIATHETAMADVLSRIDKNSQNLFAEAICKLQGRDWNLAHGSADPGSSSAGGLAIHDFLHRNHIDDAHYVLIDGSGLSRENRLTTRLLTDLLALMSHHRYADDFRSSLSINGKDGTLRKRLADLPAGSIRGKTGSIGGVRSLSGYATTRTGGSLAFSIIFNDLPRGQEKRSEELADDACRALVEWLPR